MYCIRISLKFFHLKIAKSPVFSYVSTTIAGLSVIRARNLQTKLCTEFDSLQNVHSAVWQLTTVSTTSLGLWLDCISSLFSACVTLSFLSLENSKLYKIA